MGSSVTRSSSRTKITGVCPAAQPYTLARLLREQPAPVWLVVIEEPQHADAFGEDLALFHESLSGSGGNAAPSAQASAAGERASSRVTAAATTKLEILHFPESQADHRDVREAFNAASDRLAVLSRLRKSGSQLVILTTPGALLQPVPPPEDFATREFALRRGQAQPFQALLDQLRTYDYDSEAVCEAPGQYAVRGGIVDVYPITAHQPYRLDFFGDTLEDIRALDPVTQRSGESVEQITLTAAPQIHATAARASLLDYLGQESHGVLIEPKAVEEAAHLVASESAGASSSSTLPVWTELSAKCARLFGVGDLDLASDLFDGAETEETWDSESLAHHRSSPETNLVAHERLEAEDTARRNFFTQIAAWKDEGYAVDFIISKEGEEQRTRELLDDDSELKKLKPRFVRGTVNEGFRVTFRDGRGSERAPTKGYIAVTETEIFGRKRQRRGTNRRAVVTPSAVDQLLDFSELVVGSSRVDLQACKLEYSIVSPK